MIKAYFKSYQQNNFAKSVNLHKFAKYLNLKLRLCFQV